LLGNLNIARDNLVTKFLRIGGIFFMMKTSVRIRTNQRYVRGITRLP